MHREGHLQRLGAAINEHATLSLLKSPSQLPSRELLMAEKSYWIWREKELQENREISLSDQNLFTLRR
ncbi:hypothetical protein TNCV_4292461 [Trichonephila clavipes]|uniref:Uncharacterized protein n=1 Tax=Trichonephila clavipes TaxID=2585209 RepID=A0A8X6UVE1_TRICX|nr:hypothetical protein TNCV_4292461 [Trichonephila clavipes]